MSDQLHAGAAMIDITPPPGTHLAGSGAGEHRPAQSVMDPLYAKAIAFAAGGQRVVIRFIKAHGNQVLYHASYLKNLNLYWMF